jgi:putative membrane protein
MGLWRKHRAASRYTRAILSVPQSYVINHVANPVLVLSLITAGLCALQQYVGPNALSLPTSLFSLSAPSLGLLLVFRTNASYERWDGARKMIGLVKNRSEDLTRQICTRFPENRADLKEQFLRYLHAFFFSLKVHLRSGPGGFEDDGNVIQDLTPILKPQELELALKAPNRPAHMMHCMTQVVKAAGLDGAALFCLDQNLTALADVLGGCERIRGTPIPLSYTRMTTRFLFVWLLLLPLAMSAEVMKLTGNIWLTIPAEAFIAFALLGVEEVAVQIEEPFTILPMEAYAENSRKNTGSIFGLMNEVAQVGKTIK